MFFLLNKYFILKINECGPIYIRNRRRNSQDPKNKAKEDDHLGSLKSKIANLRRDQIESIPKKSK